MPSLNLGSGEHGWIAVPENGAGERLTDWINVDRYSRDWWKKPPDVVANAIEGIPFPDDYFDRCYMGHLLEHLDYNTEIPPVLREVRRVCKNGAKVRIIGPCVDKAKERGYGKPLLDMMMPREGGDPGEHHRWVPTTELHLRVVQLCLDPEAYECDLGVINPPEWPNPAPGIDWQLAIAARIRK